MCFVCAVLFFLFFFWPDAIYSVFSFIRLVVLYSQWRKFPHSPFLLIKRTCIVLFTKRKTKYSHSKLTLQQFLPIFTVYQTEYRVSQYFVCSGIRHNTTHSILYYLFYFLSCGVRYFIWNVVFAFVGNRRAQVRSVQTVCTSYAM